MRPLPRLSWANIRRPAVDDRSLVGISFVDVLFALVIARILEVATYWDRLEAVGIWHMVVAFVLTVTSWIGYHNSLNRPRFFIRFANLPLLQFAIDVALVAVYWFTAAYVDLSPVSPSREPSAVPEVNLVFLSFVLYWWWDLIGYSMRQSDEYRLLRTEYDNRDRRLVTEVFAFVSLLTVITINFLWTPQTTISIVVVDFWLITLLVAFRVAKEATPPTEVQRRTLREDLEVIRDAANRSLGQLDG